MSTYFLDCEFIEDGHTIDLISVGVVCDDGRELYLQNPSCDFYRANDWVKAHVYSHLQDFTWMEDSYHVTRSAVWKGKYIIATMLQEFIAPEKPKPKIWGYYAAYDWVVLNQLYGPLVEHPSHWPFLAYDLRQWLDEHGLTDVKQPEEAPHHALLDARWIRETWAKYVKESQP